jgi:uncharacterized membrane protein YfcA
MSVESTIKYISMIALIATGAYMIYEGISYIEIKRANPSTPDTIYAAAVLAIFVGFLEIAFGVYHFYLISSK